MAETPVAATAGLPTGFSPTPPARFLPDGWALSGLLALYPLWWLLGLSEFVWVFFAVPMAAYLYFRGDVAVPKGFLFYALFVVWMLASVVMIDTGGRMVGFVLRASYYFSCGTILLFVLNAPGALTSKRIVRLCAIFFMIIVAGGYLGLLLPTLRFRTPMAYLMPGALLTNEFVEQMVTPGTADVQDFLGFPVPRPKAPFTFTNGWGSALALASPFAFAAYVDPEVGLSRRLVRFAMIAAVPPAVFSLNRGLWLCLTFALVYAAFRFFSAGNARAMVLLGGLFVVMAVGYTMTPLGSLVQSRIATPHSDEDRSNLYEEAISRTWRDSPFLGHGSPRPSEKGGNHPPIGTHGQLWLVLFSHGYVGVALYFPMFLMTAWRTRNASGYVGFWAHTVVLVGLLENLFYGQLPQQLTLIMIGAGVALRETREVSLTEPLLPLAPVIGKGISARSRPMEVSAMSPADGVSLGAIDRRQGKRSSIVPPRRVPTAHAGAAPRTNAVDWTRELDWLGSILWHDSARVRLTTGGPTEEELLLDTLAVSPDIAAPSLFVPQDRRVMAAVLRRYSDATPARQRIKIMTATSAARLGLGGQLVRSRVNVVGPDSLASLGPERSLIAYIEQMLGERDLRAAVTIGPRRPNRKPVIQLVRPNGQPVAFAKIGWDETTAALVRNEADWLAFLGNQRIRHFSAPRLLHASLWNGLHVAVVSAVRVHALPSRPLRQLPDAAALWEIASLGGTVTQRLADTEFVDYHLRSGNKVVTGLLPHVVNRYGESLLQIGTWHGDLSPWNLSTGLKWRMSAPLTVATDLTVFDWEFAASGVPTGFDVFHYFLQTALILGEKSGQDAIRAAWTAGKAELARVGVDAGVEHVVFACYLVELVARCEELVVEGQPERLVGLSLAAQRQLVGLLQS